MRKRIKIPFILLVLVIFTALIPITASANTNPSNPDGSIELEIDNTTIIETDTETTTQRTTDGTDYTYTTTTNSVTEINSNTSILFIPVRAIERVPKATTVRIPLQLTGEVKPVNATNQKIIWDVYSDGGTGAFISGDNVLNATSPGTVTVRALIYNGAYGYVDYMERFSVKILAPRFEHAPSRVTSHTNHVEFFSSGNFFDVRAISLNDHDLILTDDNERILLWGYPGYLDTLGSVIDGSNVIRLNNAHC